MSFFAWLTSRVQDINSLLCVGLDPHPDDVAEQSVEAVEEFCDRLVNSTKDYAAAYKPNIAFFEAYGPEGISTLQKVISRIPGEIPVILDAKRGDIASTAEAYAKAAFEELGAHAITINPYLGYDSIEPFLADPERGAFLLCKTSNPGASDLQDVVLRVQPENSTDTSESKLYEHVARLAQKWNKHDNLGLVVGATQPEALQRVRALTPEMWILAPGVGSQGGDLEIALQMGLRNDGMGLLIPISRGISRSSDPRKRADELRKSINHYRTRTGRSFKTAGQQSKVSNVTNEFKHLADSLLEAGCIKFGEFTIKSGLISPIYIDLRRAVAFPKLMELVANAYISILRGLSFDRMAGLPYAGLPIATAISILGGWPLVYPRKEAKTYGTKVEIEGVFQEGDRIVVIDDLATTGSSKFEAIEKLSSAGLKVTDIVVLIDRQSGASEALAEAGYQLHSVTTLVDLLDYYQETGKVPLKQIQSTRKFINTST